MFMSSERDGGSAQRVIDAKARCAQPRLFSHPHL